MKKFVVLYHAPATAMEQMMQNTTPEDAKKGMEGWMTWAQKCGEGLVDLGNPLAGGQRLSPAGSTSSDKEVTGYSILQAENMDAAKALLQGHPHLGWNAECAIELHEVMPLPGS